MREQFTFACREILLWSAGAVLPLSQGEAILRPHVACSIATGKKAQAWLAQSKNFPSHTWSWRTPEESTGMIATSLCAFNRERDLLPE